MKKIFFAVLAILSLGVFSCTSNATSNTETAKQADPVKENKTLVAYFSATGNTEKVAKAIAEITGGTLFEIEPAQPYTEEDLDGWNESARGTRESKDRSTRPEIKNKIENMAQFDVIYLGFPIWWYSSPTIINTFLEQYDLAGKTIIPFATSGGSDYGNTENDLKVSAPDAIFKPGKVLFKTEGLLTEIDKNIVEEWIKVVEI